MGLIVTGVHRSGTSMVAGVLARLGVTMGEGSLMSAAPENPDGFYERIDVMQLNDSILQQLGGSWMAPPNLGADVWNSVSQSTLDNYRSKLEIFSGLSHDWFVKDPRISLLLPIWDRLALRNLSLICVVRNPKDVAQSLHLRNGISHRRALSIWWAYTQSIVSNLDSRDSIFIDYDLAKRSKRAATEIIASFAFKTVLVNKNSNRFETGTDEIEDRLFESLRTGEAAKSIRPKLSRSSGTRLLKGLSTKEIDETIALYNQLKRAHGVVNPKLKPFRTPDWVFEELYDSRIEWKLTQIISSLSDELETAKIQIATQESEAKSSSATQSEELDRLKSHLITLEAERDSAQNQALLLHNEAERQRKELENFQVTSATQSEELDRLKSHLITLEAERDNLLVSNLEASSLIEKYQDSLSSLSLDLLERQKEVASVNSEREALISRIDDLTKHISNLTEQFAIRDRAATRRIFNLEMNARRLTAQLGVELDNFRAKQGEIEAIRNSRGYKLLSWIWRRKN